MRLRNLCFMVAVGLIASGCNPKDKTLPDSAAVVDSSDTATTVPPPPPPASTVTITLNCIGEDSVAIGIRPYRWTLPKNGKITWALVSENPTVTEVTLTPVTGNTWPFPGGPEVKVQKGVAVQKTRGNTNWPTNEMRYKITGSCTRPSNNVDTIVIDPIMILPN